MSAAATRGTEGGGRQGREAPGIPGCHPRARPRVPRLLPPPLAAASARETGRSGADERLGERENAPRPGPRPSDSSGAPDPAPTPRAPATPPTQAAGRAAPKTPHPTRYPRTPSPSGPGSFWKWVISVHAPSPRPPSSGQRDTHPRGSPGRRRAAGRKERLPDRRRQAGASSRREERATGGREAGRQAGRAGRGREEEVRDPSLSARPAQRYGAGLHPPPPPALRPSPPPAAPASPALSGQPRTELCRYHFRCERRARTRTRPRRRGRRK